MRILLTIAGLVFSVAATAAEPVVCGSTAEVQREAEQIASYAKGRLRARAESTAGPGTRIVNDFLVVPADDETAPFDDPADLEGFTLLFKRTDDWTFSVSREPLVYDVETGPLFEAFGRGSPAKSLELIWFAFPFGERGHTKLTLSSSRGIHFEETPLLPSRNFAAVEMLARKAPLISPLLDYPGSPSGRPDVYVKQTSGAVTITWRMQNPGVVDYDLQAVLFANGDVRFNYRKVENIGWGGVVLTTGKQDGWLAERTPLVAAADPEGDVASSSGSSAGMLDVKRVDVSRVSGSTLLEFRIQLAAAIDRSVLDPRANYLIYFEQSSLSRLEVFITPDAITYRIPRIGELTGSDAVTIDGSTISILVDEELLGLTSRSTRAWVFTGARFPADTVEVLLDLGAVAENAETDFDSTAAFESSKPFVETFSLASVNLTGVWARLQSERGYSDAEIDAVFVYTPFVSDLILKPYGAFALYSNPGADGVSAQSAKNRPRTATLVHMNQLTAFANYGTQVLMHEFGHRWLYYFDIMEQGERRKSLNPLGNHPAQFVHTPAAFNVETPRDSSVMGGATFDDLGGAFRSQPIGDWYSGFSWHELYLMGLARPEEVSGWWYIRDSEPLLGGEYFPPSGVTVSGKRVDVGVHQIISAMGPRDPAFASSQKEFRTLFVVLERKGEPVTPAMLSPEYRTRFEAAFAKATGGRGKVRTGLAPSRRRAAAR